MHNHTQPYLHFLKQKHVPVGLMNEKTSSPVMPVLFPAPGSSLVFTVSMLLDVSA